MDKNLSGVHILRVEVEKPLWVLRDDLNEERAVRATAVGRDAERNAVLAGDPKGLDYYVILL